MFQRPRVFETTILSVYLGCFYFFTCNKNCKKKLKSYLVDDSKTGCMLVGGFRYFFMFTPIWERIPF